MLTPAFELRQDDDFLIVEIKAPYSKISEAEIDFHEEEFTFYSKPYYLRLHLPGKVVENGHETAKYISDDGVYVVHMPKQSPGQVFAGLDLLTKLLAPNPRAVRARPVIEVFENQCASDEPPEVDWHVEQVPWTPQDEVSLLDGRKYGFDRQRTGVIARIKGEMPDLVDIADPEHQSVKEARQERFQAEEGHFSAEHYLADRYEPAGVEQVLAYEPPWQNLCSDGGTDNLFCFTEEEKNEMCNLPRKEYLLDRQLVVSLELGLVDILFAYAYNKRVTEGEDTVESGWNISKLSATLSWFEEFWSLEQTVQSCFRRCLVYPLYRHWALAQAVFGDVIQILQLGPRYVLRCLLEIRGIFSRHDSRYVLNDLYITDYAVWIQSVSPRHLQSLADALKRVKVRKADLNLDIPELEQGAKLAIAEVAVEEEAETSMQALCISNPLASTSNDVMAELQNRRADDDDSTSSDNSSWSDDGSDSSDSTSDSSSELDSDDDEIAAAPNGDNLSVTSNSDSNSDDGSSSEGVDLLLVKDAEPEKRR